MQNALYCGDVFHQRFLPKQHKFQYSLFLFWLDLENIEQTCQSVSGMQYNGWGLAQFKRSDYLDQPEKALHVRALERMSELANEPLQGKVFMLGQLRMLGLYFSPVNFYYLQDDSGTFTHMLAEVSNTPWNKRHHYLVNLQEQIPVTQKRFHVSPFNPMDMDYHWRVSQPNEKLAVSISCVQQDKHFEAAIALQQQPLTSETLKRAMMSIPSTALKTVWGIYWQALKLFAKRVPFYSYPK